MTLDAKITILQAAKEEKKIRKRLRAYDSVGRPVGRWVPCDLESELWDFSAWIYEIVPEPREIWLYEYPGGILGYHYTVKELEEVAEPQRSRMRHFREVIE